MPSNVMEYFKQIAKIPHCSYETDELKKFLVAYCEDKKFTTQVDEAGNIHAYKGSPKICLQSHYDMVCVGEAPNIELIEKDGFLSANNSSLGADDGMGVCISMQMMDEFENLEVIFTNDEEVGLQGATHFNYEIISDRLLNLDSEDDRVVVIGCAGGVDVLANKEFQRENIVGKIYEVTVDDLPGGHSGVEIAKNIPNAIKVLAKFIKLNNAKLVSFDGGERRNSIPSSARAIVVCESELLNDDICKFNFIEEKECDILVNSDGVINMICSFSQGVRSYNEEVGITNDSINLSIINTEDNVVKIEFFARSMTNEGIENLKFETKTLCESFGFEAVCENQTFPWKPTINDFVNTVLECLKKYQPEAKIKAIHAGLECGMFLTKKPNLLACSIGPNILSPHSIHERCEIASIDIILNTVRDIINKY